MTMSGPSSTAFSRASAASPAVEISASGVRACLSMPSTMGLSSTSSTLTLLGIKDLLALSLALVLAAVVAALAARLSNQHQLADFDTLIERLAHVIDSQGCNTGGDQRFHFDAGLGGGLYF